MKSLVKLALFLVVAAAPAAILTFLTLVPAADGSAPMPLFHFYIVTFTTFSAAVVSILLAASLGESALPRHVLTAAAFAVMGSTFFSHGLATPNALISYQHPAITWSAWLTLLGGAVLFALAGLDGPRGMPRWLPVRLVVTAAAAGVLFYSAVAAFLPDVLDAIQKAAAPWTQWTVFAITLILWGMASLGLGVAWLRSRSNVDAVLTFIAIWMMAATVSMHRFPVWNYSWWLYHITLLLGFLITVAVLARSYEQARQFRLRRYFLGLALVITALLALAASAIFTQFSADTLYSEMQSSSQTLTGSLALEFGRDLPDLKQPADMENLQGRAGLDALMDGRTATLPIQALLLYDAQGSAVYSTDPDWVGVKVQDRDLFQTALAGKPASRVLPPGQPPAAYQPKTQVSIIEAYAPFRPAGSPSAAPIGVLVSVTEAPELSQATLNARVTSLLTAATSMGLLFLALLTVVSRADSILTTRSKQLSAAYEELRQAESMRDDLTNMIVHDMRNPLTAISASLDFVNRFSGEAQAGARGRMVATAQSASNRMMLMIEDLLTVSKIEKGQLDLRLKQTSLLDVLTGAVSTFNAQAAAERKTLSLECPGALTATFDPALIRRVVENLLANAMRYTSGGDGRIQVLAAQNGDRIVVTVRDNGPGVADAQKERIFDKFVQLNGSGGEETRKGAGLGLAFCRLVVQQHGGQIRAADAPGGGSDFTFWIPASR